MLRTAVAPMNENARRLDMLVDLWKGSIDRLTGERREHEGLEWRFAKLEEDLGSFIAQAHSEGLPAKVVNPAVTKQDRTAIWVAAISGVMTTLGAIVVAYLQFVASP